MGGENGEEEMDGGSVMEINSLILGDLLEAEGKGEIYKLRYL